MTSALVLAAALVCFLLATVTRPESVRADPFLTGWLMSVTAWPILVIYAVAPLLWPEPEDAGAMFALMVYGPAAVFSVTSAVRALSSRPINIDRSAAILAGLMIYGGLAIILDRSDRLINLGMAGAMFVGFVFRYRSYRIDEVARAARLSLVAATAGVLLAVLFNSTAVVGRCRIDKCTQLGSVLTSPFAGNGNLAGIMVTALLLFALYGLTVPRILLFVLGVAAIGMLSGSRTAMMGIVIAGGVGLVLAVKLAPAFRNLLIGVALAAALGFSLLPFYGGFADTDYSLRGFLWNEAFRIIPDQPFFGHNPAYWVDIGKSMLFKANYSPHNGWLEILVSVGIFGVLTIIVAAVVKVWESPGEARPYIAGYFATILCLSSLEAVYVPYFLGITPFAAMLPYFIYSPQRRGETDQLETRHVYDYEEMS